VGIQAKNTETKGLHKKTVQTKNAPIMMEECSDNSSVRNRGGAVVRPP